MPVPNEQTVGAIDAFGRLSTIHAIIAGAAILVIGAVYIFLNFKKGQRDGPSQPNEAVILAGQLMDRAQMAQVIHEMHELTEALCAAVKQVEHLGFKNDHLSLSMERMKMAADDRSAELRRQR